jgi:hypothetical protein
VVATSRSTIRSPVQVVWAVCQDMKGAAREDVIAVCMHRGPTVRVARTRTSGGCSRRRAPRPG